MTLIKYFLIGGVISVIYWVWVDKLNLPADILILMAIYFVYEEFSKKSKD